MTFLKSIKIVGGGVALGLCLGWLVQAYLPAATQYLHDTTVPVVVAAVDLEPGMVLGPESLQIIRWPRDTAPPNSLNSMKKARGKIITTPVVKGEPILQPKLAPAKYQEPRPVA